MTLTFVACINDVAEARRRLLASDCLGPGTPHQLVLAAGMNSAAEGFAQAHALARHEWIVMLHQDVFLPPGWDAMLAGALAQACAAHPRLVVAGVWGLTAHGQPVGHVYDRDRWIGAPFSGAPMVRSLDELLLVVRRDGGPMPHPDLGWHLYGTDLCLQAEARGDTACVLHAPCEHHSRLPRDAQGLSATAQADLHRVARAFTHSANVLARRWPSAMPVATPVATVDHGFSLSLDGG